MFKISTLNKEAFHANAPNEKLAKNGAFCGNKSSQNSSIFNY